MSVKINSQLFFTIVWDLITLPMFFYHTMLKVPIRGAIKIFKSKDKIEPPVQVARNQAVLEQWQAWESTYDSSANKVFVFLKFVANKLKIYVIVVMLLSIVASILGFYKPMALKNFFEYIQTNGQGSLQYIIGVFLITQFLQIIVSEIRWTKNNLLHLHMHNMVKNMVCQKILRLSSASKRHLETGKITSYHDSDVGSIGGFIHHSIFGCIAPVRLILGCFYLYNEIGWLFIGAPILSIYSIYSEYRLRKQTDKLDKKRNLINDQLSKIVNQYLSGIRVLKYYGWQQVAKDRITEAKEKTNQLEYQMHKKWHGSGVLRGSFFNFYTLFIVILSFFFSSIHLSLSSYLILSTVIGMIREGISQLNQFYTEYKQTMISLDRLTNFLGAEEAQIQGNDQTLQKGQIFVQDAKFRYRTERAERENLIRQRITDEQDQQELKKNKEAQENLKVDEIDLEVKNLHIQKGQFAAIVGKIGSGKSTLVSAIIGQVDKVEGKLKRNGSVSYCPQIPWLRNSSIKDNIVFHSEWNKDKYEQIVTLCELRPDFEMLEKGDETLVGEKGVKLSGGQKQRISIARCLYADADINIFDDCLSALDAGVGKSIFHNGIRKYLVENGKTVLLGLNALEYLKYFDKCILMSEKKVSAVGTVDQVIEVDHGFFEFAKKMNDKNQSDKQQQSNPVQQTQNQFDELRSSASASTSENKDEKKKKFIQSKTSEKQQKANNQQQQSQDQQNLDILSNIWQLMTIDGKKYQLSFFLLIIIGIFLNLTTDLWVGGISQSQEIVYSQVVFLLAFSLLKCFFDFINSLIFWKVGQQKTRALSKIYLQRIFHAKLTWFDSVPVHQIVVRAISYIKQVGDSFRWLGGWVFWCISSIVFKVAFISYADKKNILIAIGIFAFLSLMSKFFNTLNKKFDEQLRKQSQNYGSILQQSTTGTLLIRAFNKQDNYVEQLNQAHRHICNMHCFSHNARGSLRTLSHKFISITVISCSISLILTKVCDYQSDQSCKMSPLILSLAVREMVGIVDNLNGFFHMKENVERIARKLRKILHFMDKCEVQKSFTDCKPQQNWLHSGQCNIEKISFKYKQDLPLVLQDISLKVSKGQKIGIVGRTGSGKSTMTLGFLRILEICENKDGSLGNITMDETDIANMGLHYLRHSVAIIPQDPLLFSGSFRSNIDPFNKVSDEKIMECMKKVDLWEHIKEKEGETDPIKAKLESEVEEGGANYSVGQRQLICLARALIRNPKVLLMDEATANIDLQTDQFIQKMLSREFKDTTVITIAHRLNTIINYDKIMVLEKGKVKEFDEPIKLLTDEESFFGNSIKKVGEKYYNEMVEMAKNKQH